MPVLDGKGAEADLAVDDHHRRLAERMLIALRAPVTPSNVTRLALFAGMLCKSLEPKTDLDAVEAMISGIDLGVAESHVAEAGRA